LLRRLLGALGAALTLKTASSSGSTRESALQDATAGAARAVRGSGEAALPASKARAPAVAIIVVAAALCCCSLARAADGPPATTTPAPTSTTPDAPPPDPYHPPPKSSKPKASTASRPAPVHSAPVVARRPTYSPPAAAPVAPVHRVQTLRAPRAHPKPHSHKVVHRRRHHVAAKPVAPKPVKVTFNPFANLVASSTVLATAADNSDRGRYLWFAGLAFALLASAGLSLHVLSVRMVQ